MRKPAEWLPVLALGAVVLGLLHAGLSPYGPAPENAVRWSPAGGGLRFDAGIAFSDGPLYWQESEQPRELTVQAWVLARDLSRTPRTVLALVDGARVAPLEIASDLQSTALRYRSAGRFGAFESRAVSLEQGLPGWRPVHLAVTSSAAGTRLYIDGSAPDVLRLRQPLLPAGPAFAARLVLGNSDAANSGWSGEFQGLAVLDRALDEQELREHGRRFRAGGARALLGEPRLRALYAFDEPGSSVVPNLVNPQSALQIPRRRLALRWGVLELPLAGRPWTPHALADALRNLLGFAPFGALAAAVLCGRAGLSQRRVLLLASAASALLSLAIELGQAHLPTRHSSALDLLLNSAGGAAGAAFWSALRARRASRP
jgi:VanZ family protein